MARIKKAAIVETPESAEALLKKKREEEATITVIDNAIDWFNRLSGDDNLKHAAMTTCALLRDSVGIVYLDTMWPLIPMIYDAVFESLIEHLSSKRSLHKKYKITVGRNFVMSYDNIDTDSAEQEGCFMPMMDHAGTSIRLAGKINSSKKVTYSVIDNMYGENYATNSDIEHIKATADNKLRKMYTTDKDGKVLESDKSQIYLPSNLIMIIFSLFHDCVLARLKMMKESNPDDDVEINVLGLYVAAIEDVESPDANYEGYYIHYAPKDIVKLALKSDALAGSEKK
jgi:hypothetical protein